MLSHNVGESGRSQKSHKLAEFFLEMDGQAGTRARTRRFTINLQLLIGKQQKGQRRCFSERGHWSPSEMETGGGEAK